MLTLVFLVLSNPPSSEQHGFHRLGSSHWYPLSAVLCSAGIIEEMGTVVKLCKVPGSAIPTTDTLSIRHSNHYPSDTKPSCSTDTKPSCSTDTLSILALSDHLPDLVLWDGTTGEGVTLELRCTVALGDVYEGASIAVNGTCLTVTHFQKDTDEPACTSGTFVVNMAPETLRCTNLGKVPPAQEGWLPFIVLAAVG